MPNSSWVASVMGEQTGGGLDDACIAIADVGERIYNEWHGA